MAQMIQQVEGFDHYGRPVTITLMENQVLLDTRGMQDTIPCTPQQLWETRRSGVSVSLWPIAQGHAYLHTEGDKVVLMCEGPVVTHDARPWATFPFTDFEEAVRHFRQA